MKRIIKKVRLGIVTAGLLLTQMTIAQNTNLLWAKSTSITVTTGDMTTNRAVVDANGNVFTTGKFKGTVDFDPGPSVYNLTAVGSSDDIFILKLNAAGGFVAAVKFGDQYDDEGLSIAVDASGNVFTTGRFAGNPDFDPGPGTFGLYTPNPFDTDVFISKLTGGLVFQFALQLGGGNADKGNGIAIDANGDVYVAGEVNPAGGADLDPTGGYNPAGSFPGLSAFVVKLNNTGTSTSWVYSTGGNFDERARDITVVGSHVYVTGDFAGTTVNFGAGPNPSSNANSIDVFVLKLDLSAIGIWVKSMGGAGSEIATAIAVDASGNVYTTGDFNGANTDFDPGTGTFNLSANTIGVSDMFVSKLDASGNFVWAKQIGGSSSASVFGTDIALDALSNVYTTGFFNGATTDFNPGVGVFNLSTFGSYDCFISKLDAAGNFVFANQLGGSNFDGGYGIAIDASNDIFTTGVFSSAPADFDPNAGTFTISSISNLRTVFVQKMCQTPNIPSVISGTNALCVGAVGFYNTVSQGASSYVWNLPVGWSGTSTLSSITATAGSSGIFTVSGVNTCGTGPTQTLQVTVNASPLITVNSGSICSGNSFTIVPSGASTYTISGGSSVVSPTANTNYTVTGTSTAGCVSSSLAVSSLTVRPRPVINIGNYNICSGSTVTLTPGGGATYTFSSGSATIAPTINTTVSIVGANVFGCVSSNTAVTSIFVNPIPTVAVNSGTICSGNSFSIVPTGASTYTIGGGSSNVSPLSSTSYTVIGASAFGCVSANTATSNVSVNATPTVSVNSGAICVGNSFTIVPSGANTYTISGGSSVVSPTANTNYNITGTSAQGCVSSNTAVSSVTVSTTPTVSVNSGSICSGNSFTIVPSGASTYTIQGGSSIVSPLSNTSYTVRGTSAAGCISANTATSNVIANASPTVSVTSGAICNGQSFTIVPSGASTYTYSSGSAVVSPTANTSYNVTGTSTQGCVSSNTAVSSVTVNALPVISVPSATICAGATGTLTASGAATYTWNTGSNASSISASPLTTTTYTANGTSSAGCVGSAVTATITVGAAPSIVVNSATVCAGSSATLNASGVTTYTWNTGANSASIVVTPTANTTYSVSGNLTGCGVGANNTTSVAVNALPIVSAVSNASLICVGQTASLTANGASTYTWNTSATTGVIAVSPTVTTSYTVNGTASNGCSNIATITQSVSTCTGINNLPFTINNLSLLVYPNPTNDVLNIQLGGINGDNTSVELVNALGQVIVSKSASQEISSLDVTSLTSGIYFVKLIQNGKVVDVKKLVKN